MIRNQSNQRQQRRRGVLVPIVAFALVAVMGGLCVANGDTNALGLGAVCKPSAAPQCR